MSNLNVFKISTHSSAEYLYTFTIFIFYMIMGLVAADEYCTTNYLGQPSQTALCSTYCCGTYDYRYCCSDCTKSYVSICSTYGLPNSCSHFPSRDHWTIIKQVWTQGRALLVLDPADSNLLHALRIRLPRRVLLLLQEAQAPHDASRLRAGYQHQDQSYQSDWKLAPKH